VALATAGGFVVAGGLSSAHVSTSTVWTLSTSGRVLQSGSLAVPVHDATGLVVNRTPFVIAGGNTTTVGDLQRIAGSDDARVVGHLPQPRSDLSAAYIKGSGYVVGGFDGTTSLSQILRTTNGRTFAPFATLRITVRYAAVAGVATSAGDQLLVFGGEHDGVPIDDVQDVDLTTGRTRIAGHLPEPLAHEAAFTLDNVVWLAGGRSHDQLQSRIWRWDPGQRRAMAAGRLPYAVADAGVAGDDAKTTYLMGGETPEPTARVIVLDVR
jgi:N-acetylneuraminic acid mutarotase